MWSIVSISIFILIFHYLFVKACEYNRPKPKWIVELKERWDLEDEYLDSLKFVRMDCTWHEKRRIKNE